MDLAKVTNRLHHYKQLRALLEAHETKSGLIGLRNKWLKKQKQNNYQNEYERIRGELSNSVLKGESRTHLEKREEALKKLGAKAVFQIT